MIRRVFFSLFANALTQASRSIVGYARSASSALTEVSKRVGNRANPSQAKQQSTCSILSAQQRFNPARELALVGVAKRRRPIRETTQKIRRELNLPHDPRLGRV